jgi:uracil-DNA glycosylase
MSKAPHYLEFFGSDTLKRLHGCAVAENARGQDSPCHGLARSVRRPQIGLGNPQAPIVFLGPSPLDPASAGGEAFTEWLERETDLEHRLVSQTVQPYVRYVRAVTLELRKRLGQEAGRHDPLELGFHTSITRCPTENPDRVTEGAVNQCAERHLEATLKAVSPRAIVAMGAGPARYFWWRSRQGWAGWSSVEALHGEQLQHQVAGRAVPVILSVHPYQQLKQRPEVIGRVLSQYVTAGDLQGDALKAA